MTQNLNIKKKLRCGGKFLELVVFTALQYGWDFSIIAEIAQNISSLNYLRQWGNPHLSLCLQSFSNKNVGSGRGHKNSKRKSAI